MRKKIFFIFLTLVMLMTILIIYVNNFFFPVQFKQIVIQKAEKFLNRAVSFDSIRFHPIKGIVITNLDIADKDSPEAPFVHVDELSASVLYAPIFRDKKVIIPHLIIVKPVVSLKRNSTAEWNFSDLLNSNKPPGTQNQTSATTKSPLDFFLGGVSIVDGDLTILDKSVEPAFFETLEDVNLKVSLSPQKGIKFSLETVLPKSVSTLKLQGTSDFSLQKINARLQAANVKLGAYLAMYYKNDDLNFINGTFKTLEANFDRQGNTFHAKAQLELNDLDLKVFPNQEFKGQIKIPELTLTLDLGKSAALKGSLEILSADIRLGEEEKLRGDFKTNNLSWTWQPDKTQVQGSFTVNNANWQLNEEQALSGGPIEARDFSLLLSPDGQINLAGNLMKADNFFFHLNDRQSIQGQLQAGPLTLTIHQDGINGTGNLQLNSAQIQLDQKNKLNGQLQASECFLTINQNGTYSLKGNLRLADADLLLGPDQEIKGQLTAANTSLSGDEKNIVVQGALSLKDADIKFGADQKIQGNIEAPDLTASMEGKKFHLKTNADVVLNDINALLADKAAAGNLKLGLDLTFNPDEKTPLTYNGSLTPNLAIVSGIPLIQEIKNISGKINFTTNQVNFETLKLSALDTAIELSGSVGNFSDPLLDISASTDKFDLEKISLLAPQMLEQMKIKPTGEAKISMRIKDNVNRLTSVITQANMHVTVLLKDTVLEGESLPAPVGGINGEITYTPDTLSWKDLQAEFQGKDFFSSGQCNNFSSPEIQGTLSSKILSLNLSTQAKLMDKILGIDSLKGRFQNSSFDIAGKISLIKTQEPLADLKGQIRFDLKDIGAIQPEFQKTLEPFKPEGIINLDGNLKGMLLDWHKWDLSFNAQSPQIVIAGYTIKDISLKAVENNQWVKHFDLSADIYDGKLTTEGALSLADEGMPFQISIDLQSTNLQKLKEVTIWKDNEVSGVLSGTAQLKGPLTDWKAIEGDGTVLIHDGNIWQLNLFKGLGKIIFTSDFENIPIQEVSANFNIQNQKVSTKNLILKSPVFSILGKGWVNFENQLNFNLTTQFEERLPTGTESYQEKASFLATQFGSILNIKITGLLSDPKFTAVPAPGRILEKGIKLLFEGMKDVL